MKTKSFRLVKKDSGAIRIITQRDSEYKFYLPNGAGPDFMKLLRTADEVKLTVSLHSTKKESK